MRLLLLLVGFILPMYSMAQGGNIMITPITNPNSGQTQTETSMGFENSNTPDKANTRQLSDCHKPMENATFKSARESIAHTTYEDTKLSTAENILATNCVSSEQVAAICQLFGFEGTKLKFAKDAYFKTTDVNNYNKVSAILNSEIGKNDLNNFIKNGGK